MESDFDANLQPLPAVVFDDPSRGLYHTLATKDNPPPSRWSKTDRRTGERNLFQSRFSPRKKERKKKKKRKEKLTSSRYEYESRTKRFQSYRVVSPIRYSFPV